MRRELECIKVALAQQSKLIQEQHLNNSPHNSPPVLAQLRQQLSLQAERNKGMELHMQKTFAAYNNDRNALIQQLNACKLQLQQAISKKPPQPEIKEVNREDSEISQADQGSQFRMQLEEKQEQLEEKEQELEEKQKQLS